MPHVAMVIPSLAGGGAERTALRLSGGQAARGHRVDLVLFQPHVAYPAEVPEAARLLVLCGRRVWDRRNPGAMPSGGVTKTRSTLCPRATSPSVRTSTLLSAPPPVRLRSINPTCAI